MDDQVDIAPVDAEIERRGGNDGAQLVLRHCRLDPPALADIERAVMQRDRQIVVVDRPEVLKQQLRLAAGVDEKQRRLLLLDGGIDVRRSHSVPNDRTRACALPS